MLTIAEDIGNSLNLKFNPTKCQLLKYCSTGLARDEPPVPFCGINVSISDSAIHLGHRIDPKCRDIAVTEAVNDLYRRTNILMNKFGHCSPDLRYKLFKTYCMSVYGSNLWNYDSNAPSLFHCAWRKCVRKVWNLPFKTHCTLLPAICQDFPIDFQLHKRFHKFFMSCVSSRNEIVSLCARLAVDGSHSDTSNSLSLLCDILGCNRANLPPVIEPPTVDEAVGGAIRAFSIIRHESPENDIKSHMNDIIDFLCTY